MELTNHQVNFLTDHITDNLSEDLLRTRGTGLQYFNNLNLFILHHHEMEWTWRAFHQELNDLFEDDCKFAIKTLIRYGNFGLLEIIVKEVGQ